MDTHLNILMQPSDEVVWRQVGLFDKADSLENKQIKSPYSLFKSPFLAEFPEGQPFVPLTADRVPITVPSLSGGPCLSSRPSPLTGCSNFPTLQGIQKAPSNLVQSAPYGRKEWKSNRRAKRLVLGDGVGLEDLCKMSLYGLVGLFSYKKFSSLPLEDWIKLHWLPLLGYSPEVIYLKKGWHGFICKSPEDASLLLNNLWVFGGSSLMLKR
jgi:hypothetical protein